MWIGTYTTEPTRLARGVRRVFECEFYQTSQDTITPVVEITVPNDSPGRRARVPLMPRSVYSLRDLKAALLGERAQIEKLVLRCLI